MIVAGIVAQQLQHSTNCNAFRNRFTAAVNAATADLDDDDDDAVCTVRTQTWPYDPAVMSSYRADCTSGRGSGDGESNN